jgi:REP element-mobilizing transposase RayT
LKIGGIADHVHVLCRFGRSIKVADLLRELKRDSSKWVKERAPQLADFQWQTGYGAFSISPGHVPGLTHYIATQEERHRESGESYQDEFRRICGIYGVPIDERYVWD